MTDYLNRFGELTASASTTLTSGNVLDFGPIDTRAAMQTHRTGEAPEETVVFRARGIGSSVTLIPKLQDSADNTTFTDLVAGQVSAAGPSGDFAFIPFPKIHKRFVRAVATASASTTTSANVGVSARIEPGPAKPRS